MKTVGAYLLMGTALLACPCHLVFLLPAVLGLLGGTALGTALGANTGWVITAATVYFVGALAGGLYLLNRRAKHEENPKPSPVGSTPKHRAPSRSRGMARGGR